MGVYTGAEKKSFKIYTKLLIIISLFIHFGTLVIASLNSLATWFSEVFEENILCSASIAPSWEMNSDQPNEPGLSLWLFLIYSVLHSAATWYIDKFQHLSGIHGPGKSIAQHPNYTRPHARMLQLHKFKIYVYKMEPRSRK